MSIKCKLGFHNWDSCKCTDCGKIRDEQHDYSKDCEKCSKCGKTRVNQHDYSKDCEKCSKCAKTRENQHDYTKDCNKCSKCGKTKENQHDWKGCKCTKCGKTRDEQHDWNGCKCTRCGQTRNEQHDWSKDCEKCSRCGKTRTGEHNFNNGKCSKCGKSEPLKPLPSPIIISTGPNDRQASDTALSLRRKYPDVLVLNSTSATDFQRDISKYDKTNSVKALVYFYMPQKGYSAQSWFDNFRSEIRRQNLRITSQFNVEAFPDGSGVLDCTWNSIQADDVAQFISILETVYRRLS